ncbi:MAG: carboxypeptidase regulatory-like domain-containing protein [Pyrinomonadaceae bacterium]|nr:carboxypeptidase regulatory-like domain-containing protein [Pyrinomonadaceae bacterium]
MKKKALLGFWLVMLALAPDQLSAAPVAQGRSAITGTVFGEAHRPVPDIYVELLDDFNSTINRSKTDASGRFAFNGLISGRYKVKALPYGTGYLEQSQEVILTSVSAVPGSGADRQNIDIVLRVDERFNASPFAVIPGVVFAQDVPEPARKLYTEGVRFLREKKEQEAFESLKKSIEIFPTYYMALDRLGGEYATRGPTDRSYYEAGLVLLTKAVEVNPRGTSSVFGKGWTEYQLGLNSEAIETLTRLTTLAGKFPEAYLWLGRAQKRASMLDRAEESFKKADEVGKGKLADVHWQLAGLYSDQKRYAEAANQFELFLKAQPKTADAEKIKAIIKQLREKATTK